MGNIFCVEFQRVPWNSTQNILPIHWKMQILYKIENLSSFGFKSSYAFWKCRPDHIHLMGVHVTTPVTNHNHNVYIFSCDQAALQMVFSVCLSVCLSVCPSVRPSVRHTFLTMFPSLYHHEIFRSYYQWQKWCPCKRSRSEVKGQGHRGHNPT